jgi:hypothetical protein
MAYNLGEIQPGAYVIKAKATAAITKGYFVVITPASTGPTVAIYTGAKPAGVIGVALDAAAAANDVIRVCIDGMVSVQCDNTGVYAFAFVSSDGNGKAEAATIGTDYVVGIALDAGAAKGVALVKLNQIVGVKSA